MYYSVISINIGIVFSVLLVFGILKWLQIPTGSFLDWVIAVAIFEWLLAIVTIPWNIHFEAKEVIAEATESTEKGIKIEQKQVNYARIIAKRSLFAAITLHLISAIGFYTLAVWGISAIGYLGSAAALLLTILRPAVRAYQYLAARLTMIRQQVKYPREDILELRNRFRELEATVQRIEEKLNPEYPDSWVATQQRQWEATRHDLNRIAANLEELKANNQAEHNRLSREAEQAIAQLSTDGQFLDHVREIIRFFKSA
ncbi:hypothetical protein IQ264_14280 [Phormidium sp. LEGE 05292]|uniref:hypothetical protein n=1 Tax=[Phormidium] sp. LEGE 05292 TaxID=767427 RepID=UPI0018813C2E|nr:hypothetical protein [Phormidium sp. LEGE 05292]MBE9226592.1 hypothetical protein [Phormidium sp. LEGE 05292]